MCQDNYNTNKRNFKQLTYKDRVKSMCQHFVGNFFIFFVNPQMPSIFNI